MPLSSVPTAMCSCEPTLASEAHQLAARTLPQRMDEAGLHKAALLVGSCPPQPPSSHSWEGRVVPDGIGAEGRGDAETPMGKQVLQQIKDAGMAGIISYGVVQLVFFGASIPVCVFAYYQVTGHWPDLANPEDQAQLAAEAFAFLNLARLAIPLRIALALAMSQKVQTGIIDKFQKRNQQE
jgi:hypothetical protein